MIGDRKKMRGERAAAALNKIENAKDNLLEPLNGNMHKICQPLNPLTGSLPFNSSTEPHEVSLLI